MPTLDDVTSFRALHSQSHVLAIANVWDAATAALFKAAGAQAIATTSAGFAWAAGFADGDSITQDALLAGLRPIIKSAAGVPVSADIEGGYSSDPQAVAELVAALRALGVAGINIEDGTTPPQLLVDKIRAIKRTLHARGTDIFINARTDVVLHDLAVGEEAIRESIARAKQYDEAGADGIFVPFLSEGAAIRAIASATPLPLNLLAIPELAPLRELYALGVRRVSAGSSLANLAFGTARRAAVAFLREGSLDALFSDASTTGKEMNAFFPNPVSK